MKQSTRTIDDLFSKRQLDRLDQLIHEGYGATREEVVQYLIARELDELLRAKVIN